MKTKKGANIGIIAFFLIVFAFASGYLAYQLDHSIADASVGVSIAISLFILMKFDI